MQSSDHHPACRRRRHALFGGSFDPVHLGHTAMAAAAHHHHGVEKVIFVPAAQSPHKRHSDPPAPAHHRLAMLEMALAGRSWVEVSRHEIERPGPSYSWRTAEHFAALAGSDIDLCWILGADQWSAITTWSHPERLAALLTFLVVPRAGFPVVSQRGFRHECIDSRHPASSTAVRAAVRAGLPLDGLVTPAVARYMATHGLYGPKSAAGG